MRNNETGEFELLVGNRQLLSGFFIVVLLFAVAFSMGYIVGRNSSPSAKSQVETGSSAGTASQTPETRPQAAAQAPAAGGAPGPEGTPASAGGVTAAGGCETGWGRTSGVWDAAPAEEPVSVCNLAEGEEFRPTI